MMNLTFGKFDEDERHCRSSAVLSAPYSGMRIGHARSPNAFA
jgi:hypothetical protein